MRSQPNSATLQANSTKQQKLSRVPSPRSRTTPRPPTWTPPRPCANIRIGPEPDEIYYTLTNNQAWFSRIYIDAHKADHGTEVTAVPERTPIAAALEGCRRLVTTADAQKEETDRGGSVSVLHPGICEVQVSSKTTRWS